MSDTSQQMDVSLEMFEGPLDLLLHLIKKNDLEISDIPIAQITHEYLEYLDVLKDLNLEMAGEFLVMASTLMQIKAQMLLPSPDTGEEDGGPDPRAELVNKLLEYQRFKEAAGILSVYNEKAKDIYYRHAPPQFDHQDFMLRATVLDLLSAFKRVLDQAPREVGQILREEITIEAKIRDVLNLLDAKTSLAFEELFTGSRRRMDLIVTFLALLELIRMKQIVAMQSDSFGSIRIFRAEAAPRPLVDDERGACPAPPGAGAPAEVKSEGEAL
jgi:segregation and condensation protein A